MFTQRNPLGTSETTKAVYDPLGNYIPFQASGDPRPPAGSFSSASMGGLSSSQANPFSYAVGCMFDGVPTTCNKVVHAINNGQAKTLQIDGRQNSNVLLANTGIFLVEYPTDNTRPTRPSRRPFKPNPKPGNRNPYNIGPDEHTWGLALVSFEVPQDPVMVSITPDQFKNLVQNTLNYGDCKDFVAKLISKAAELTEGKNDAINTDVMKLFDMINNQIKGGGFRLNASFKDIPSYLPPVSGGSGLAFGNVPYGNGVAMVFQRGYYSDRPQGQVERIMANYGLTGVHEIIHLAGSRTTYSEELLGRAAKAIDPNSTSYDNGLMKHCLPANLR